MSVTTWPDPLSVTVVMQSVTVGCWQTPGAHTYIHFLSLDTAKLTNCTETSPEPMKIIASPMVLPKWLIPLGYSKYSCTDLSPTMKEVP